MLQTTYAEFGERTFAAGRYPYALTVLELIQGKLKNGVVSVSSVQIGEQVPTQLNQGYLKAKKEVTKTEYPELAESFGGWLGGVYADTLGKLVTEEVAVITYPEATDHTHFALWTGKTYRLRDFSVQWYLADVLVKQESITDNKETFWSMQYEQPVQFDRIELHVTRVYPRGGNVQVLFFGPVHRLVLTPEVMSDFTIQEDLVMEGENPLGHVNTNSLDLALENVQGWFTPTLKKSPFYNLIKPRMHIHPLGGFKMKDGIFELVSLGHFYTNAWTGSRAVLSTAVHAYDRLGNFLSRKLPPIPPYKDMTPQDFFRLLLHTLGLEEGVDFWVDPRIVAEPRLCWTDAGTYGEAFSEVALAGNFYVTCNRAGKISALANKGVEGPAQVFTGDNLLIDTTVPQLYSTVSNEIKIHIYALGKGTKSEVWRGSATIPPTGTHSLEEITFSDPITHVTEVQLQGHTDVVCSYMVTGASSALMTLNNTATTERQLEVIIQAETIAQNSIVKTFGDAVGEEVKSTEIDNKLIQTEQTAMTLGSQLLTFLSDVQRESKSTWRPDLRTELGDIVTIDNEAHDVEHRKVVVKSLKLDYDGGFTGTIITQKEMM